MIIRKTIETVCRDGQIRTVFSYVVCRKTAHGMEYAASIVHRLEHGKTVFTPDERNLIVSYGYKLDDYEKTKELAETLAYWTRNEPVNASLTVIDAQAEIDALPDSMIGLSEMHEYGYFANDMYPFTKESALELFDRDLPMYLLYGDSSETVAEDSGIFGIEKGENPAWLDWQNEKEYSSMQAEQGKAEEKDIAFQIADRYISIQETEGGYHYSIMNMDYKEIESGVYEKTGVGIQETADDIVDDLREDPFDNGVKGSIGDDDEILQGNIVENFKEKTNEFFHEICEMNPSEIEDTVKYHVQAKIDDYAIAATVVDVAISGSRCRGLERNGSDLDCGKRHDKGSHALELSTNERKDDLFNAFNNDDGM